MVRVGLLNAYGSTVGDNLEHHLVAAAIKERGHEILHFWNFYKQDPQHIMLCSGLVAGCGGILWKGRGEKGKIRDRFFLRTINLSRRALGVSIGYNQTEPLDSSWSQAVDHMDKILARDTHTLTWIQKNSKTPAACYPSVAWTYKPPGPKDRPKYDLGLILNRGAMEINLGSRGLDPHPLRLWAGLRGLDVLDIPFAQPIEQPFLPGIPNNNKLAAVASRSIRQCKVILTGRLHGFILALLNDVPAVILGPSFKVLSQARMIGYPFIRNLYALRDYSRPDWTRLIEKVEGLDLRPYVEKAQEGARHHIEELDKWVSAL